MTDTAAQEPRVDANPGADAYARLLLRLHELNMAGQAESPTADELRDEMTWHWYRMSAREQDLLTGLSADLNSLEAGGSRPVAASEGELTAYRTAARAAYESADAQQQLEFLRKPYPVGLPAGSVPFMQARVWERLGFLDVAIVFMKEAAKHDPIYDVFVMHLLQEVGRLTEAESYAKRMLAGPHPRPIEIYFAAGVLFDRTRGMSDSEARAMIAPLIPALSRVLKAEQAASPGRLPPGETIEVGIALSLGLCLERTSRAGEAVSVYDQELARLPTAPDLAMLLTMKGIARHQMRDPDAMKDLWRAVQAGATVVWPYYLFSAQLMQQGKLLDALKLCNLALEKATMPSGIRAEMHGWVAVIYAALGSPDLAERNFGIAVRLDPDNGVIRKNREVYERSRQTGTAVSDSDFFRPTLDEALAKAGCGIVASAGAEQSDRLANKAVGSLLAA